MAEPADPDSQLEELCRILNHADLIRSKELLRRAKDIEHLAALYHHFPQLAAGPEQLPPAPE